MWERNIRTRLEWWSSRDDTTIIISHMILNIYGTELVSAHLYLTPVQFQAVCVIVQENKKALPAMIVLKSILRFSLAV
jgi:hypothetical protein